MGAGYGWAVLPLLRMRASRPRQGIGLLRIALGLLSLRMFLAAGYEMLQIARGLPRQPESPVLTVAQLSLLIVFGLATAIALIDAEREAQVRLEGALLQAQRLDSLGHMAGGIAHDFNNTLFSIVGGVELALEEASRGEPVVLSLTNIGRAAERGASLTKQLLMFARRQTVRPQRFDAGAQAAGLESMLTAVLGRRIQLHLARSPEPCGICADPTQFDQVLLNLAINARDAMPDGGRVMIQVSATRDTVRIAVEDTGHGIAASTLPHIFEPFFTTKAEDRGTGLGLSTAYGFARQAGGMLSVESTEGVGTRFFVDLPLVALEGEAV